MKLYALRLTRDNGTRYYYGFAKHPDQLDALTYLKAEQERDKKSGL